jgi:hypothetical protein
MLHSVMSAPFFWSVCFYLQYQSHYSHLIVHAFLHLLRFRLTISMIAIRYFALKHSSFWLNFFTTYLVKQIKFPATSQPLRLNIRAFQREATKVVTLYFRKRLCFQNIF